jgi:iron complex outermembrane receptor protein
MTNFGCSLGASLLLAVTTINVMAASTAPDSVALEEIVVTAEKVESTVQRTAATISVVDSAALSRQQIVEIKDLNSVLLDTQILPIVNGVQIVIRGIGSNFIDPRADPSVAASLNGLYFDRPLPDGFAFLDVARVELLNGPQGTLYGRNSAAGALNIVTNQPTDKFEGMVQGTVGNLRENDLTAVLNMPLGSTFAVRLAYERDRSQGYIGGYYDDVHSDTYRVSARWTPTDSLSISAESDYLRTGGHGGIQEAWPCTGAQPWSLDFPAGCSLTGSGGTIPETGNVGTFVAANQVHVDYDFDLATLTSITGFVGTHQRFFGLPNGIYFNSDSVVDNYDYSEEIRLAGHDSASHQGGLGWQAGAYFFSSTGKYYNATPGFGAPTTFTKLPQSSQAGFGQISYGFTDRLRLTVGARFTHDYKGLDGDSGAIKVDGNRVNYKGVIEYDVAPAKLLYGAVSTGYVAGGPNGGDPNLPTPPTLASAAFEPETITAYEVGSKNRFLDNRLQLNGDFYYYDFKAYQYTEPAFLNTYPQLVNQLLVIDNIGSVKTYGLELQGEFALTPKDRFSASLTRSHGTFGAISIATLGGFPPNFVPGVIVVGAGAPLVNIPDWSALLGYEHTWQLNQGSSVAFSVNSKLSTKYPLVVGSTDPFDTQPGYTRTDASLSYHWPDNRYVVRGWAKNLENAPVNTYGQTAGFHNYGILSPRTYGVTLTAKF